MPIIEQMEMNFTQGTMPQNGVDIYEGDILKQRKTSMKFFTEEKILLCFSGKKMFIEVVTEKQPANSVYSFVLVK
jgi:hypothetical protein